MDERMQGSWIGYSTRKRAEGSIRSSLFHHGHHFYFSEDDEDAEEMYDEPLTQKVLDEFDRSPNAMYGELDAWHESLIRRMNQVLGIKEEPKREATVKRVTKPTPVKRAEPLLREDGQMRLF